MSMNANLDLAAITTLRAEVWGAGYRPIAILGPDHPDPVRAGKSPAGKEWTERARQDPPEAVRFAAVSRLPNTGILADGLRAIDIDIDDPTLANQIRALALDMLGDTIVRTRSNSGRCLLPYRAAANTSPQKRVLAGKLGKVEVLGHGQQFVAFGIHPSGAELRWVPVSPAQMPRDGIPEVTEDQISEFFAAAVPLIEAEPEHKLNGKDGPHYEAAGNHPADILDVIAALAVIPNDKPSDWEFWNNIGMATWAETGGSVFAYAAWAAWSSKHLKHDLAACRERWKHYPTSPPDKTGAGKLFHLAAEAVPGWRKPSDAKPAQNTNTLWCDTGDWTEADIPKRPWVAPGFLLRGSVTLLAGPPSAMKSSIVLAWACALALNRAFGRFLPVMQGVAIVYNVEDDQFEQRRRLSATLRQFGARPADIRDKVIRTGPSGIGTLLTRDDKGRVHFTPAMDRLEEMIRFHKPAFLAIDPFAELHTVEENDNVAIRAIVARFRELAAKHDIAVVLAHHTRKGGATSPGDPDVARGASALIGAARVVLTLIGMSEDDARALGIPTDTKARSTFIRLDDAKQNYAPIRDAQWFQKAAYVLDNNELVAAAEPWIPPSKKQASQSDMDAIATAIQRGIDNEPYSPQLSSYARSVRPLLELHGFHGADAQKEALEKLKTAGVTIGSFTQKGRRHSANGLHVAFRPAADWVGQPAEAATEDVTTGNNE
jgi:RecA-family ATPase